VAGASVGGRRTAAPVELLLGGKTEGGFALRRALFSLVVVAALTTLFAPPAAPTAGAVVRHRTLVKVGASQSNNWSGYNQGLLERGTQFHQVSGDWTVPTATQHKRGEAEYSSTWVGIGGGCIDSGCLLTDNTLIQAGTEQDVDAAGHASYSAWWELIPLPGITIDTFAVKAGDRVHFDIRETLPEVWVFTAKNLTTGATWTMTVPYVSTYATAEWIHETPIAVDDSGNVSIGPLPSLSTVPFDNALVNGQVAGLNASEEIQLVDANSTPLATPSAPDSDHDGFNVCSYSGSCAAPTSS
jgi:hypothetical protein